MQPERIKNNEELRAKLEGIQPDAIIVVAYGRIIPGWMLELPRFGNINLHGSLLPKYRGAAPVQWAVANGEAETGVTTMQLDAGLDTGDMLLERRLSIPPAALASDLFYELAEIGAELMIETLHGLEQGTLHARPQDHASATLAPILKREDGRMELRSRSAREVVDRWRGFYPWPGAHGTFRGKRFLVHRMHVAGASARLEPGALDWSNGELRAGAANQTAVVLDEVQLEGKQRVTGMDFVRGFQVQLGEHIE